MPDSLDPDRLRALIDVGGFIVSELDRDAVLEHVLDAACQLTRARYAALGVVDTATGELERFITRGVDDDTARAIGDPPHGRGVLGVLILDPVPLRLANVGRHPTSFGFPAGHPPMESFLGVPVFVRGQVWGNLYLTEKEEGQFDEADEDAAVVLARWAGIAIENARLYRDAQERQADLERAVRGLEATQAVVLAVGGETRLDRVLELIAKRGRALVDARTIVILLRHDDELELAALAGYGRRDYGARIPIEGSTSGEIMLRGETRRLDSLTESMSVAATAFGIDDASRALVVPLIHRAEHLGVLIAFDQGPDRGAFDEHDEQALLAFGASAATAVAMTQGATQGRVPDAVSADAERAAARERLAT